MVTNINTICILYISIMSETWRRATMSDLLEIPKYDKTQNDVKIMKNQEHFGQRKRIKP